MNDLNDQQKPVAEGLPELCFTTLPSTGELICIKRGELGYYPSSWNTDDKQRNEELANYNLCSEAVPGSLPPRMHRH